LNWIIVAARSRPLLAARFARYPLAISAPFDLQWCSYSAKRWRHLEALVQAHRRRKARLRDQHGLLLPTISTQLRSARRAVLRMRFNLAPVPGLKLAVDARLQLFVLAMPGHTSPILINLSDTPVVFRVSVGQNAALVDSRRACRADLIAGPGNSRASTGHCSHPESCDHRGQSELRHRLG